MLTVVFVCVKVCAATELARRATAATDWKSMLMLMGLVEKRMNRSTGCVCMCG